MAQRPTIMQNRLAIQMVIWFAAISLFPLTIATFFNYQNAARTVERQVSENLWAIAQRQSNSLRNLFQNKEQFASIIALTPEITQAASLLGSVYDAEVKRNSAELDSIRASFEPVLKGLAYQYGFTQLYLVSNAGDIMISVGKNSVIYSNLLTGPLSQTPLAQAFQDTSMLMSPQFSDFALFAPNNGPAIFIGAPILEEGRLKGMLILQLDPSKIYRIAENYSGLGETGETILASEQGGRIVALNPLRHIPDAAFNIFFKSKSSAGQLLPIEKALRGQSGYGEDIVDYREKKVLAAWEYFPKLRWGLEVKIDRDETLVPVVELRQLSIFIGLGTLIVVLAAAILAAGTISQPIIALTEVASRIARGDLTPHVERAPSNEIGVLARAIETMARNLKSLVNQVKNSSTQVADFTQDLSQAVREQSDAAQQYGGAALEITASAKEISVTAKDLAGTMQEVNEVAQDTALLAESGIDGLQIMEASMGELADANSSVSAQLAVIQKKAADISFIITTMTKVADQTNLLSLNAAIEARKAKEYGTGFRVVAKEIRRLADQTAGSSLEIESMIGEMLGAVQTGVNAMKHLSQKVEYSVDEITTVSSHLANVIQQVQGLPPRFEMVLQGMQSQADGADQIKEAINRLSNSAQQTVTSLKNTSNQIDKLRNTTKSLQGEISRFHT